MKLFKTEITRLTVEGKKIIVLEAAVLFEAGMDSLCDYVWVVGCPPSVQIDRVMSRNGLSVEQAKQRVNS